MKEATHKSTLKFLSLCQSVQLANICSVDELLLFCKATSKRVSRLMEAFEHFSKCTGLTKNASKSQVVMTSVTKAQQEKTLEMIGFYMGPLPLKYQSLPIMKSRLTKTNYQYIIDKICRKIRSRQLKRLSYTRKIELVNSVLMGMH